MARKLRVQYPGAIYRSTIRLRRGCGGTGVMSRGDHLEIIFRDDPDRELFLATLGEASTRTDWQVHV
jgi:hypothetical protein